MAVSERVNYQFAQNLKYARTARQSCTKYHKQFSGIEFTNSSQEMLAVRKELFNFSAA